MALETSRPLGSLQSQRHNARLLPVQILKSRALGRRGPPGCYYTRLRLQHSSLLIDIGTPSRSCPRSARNERW